MRTTFGIAVTSLLGLGACVSNGIGDHGRASTCRPAAAAALVGRAAPDDAAMRRQTRSTIVRRLVPGGMATTDLRPDRVTVTVDQGRITAATCG